MSISFVNKTTAAMAVAGTTLTVNVPAGSGQILFAQVVCPIAQAAITQSSWTLLSTASAPGDALTQCVFYRYVSSEPASYNFTVPSSKSCGCMLLYAGNNPALDQGSGNSFAAIQAAASSISTPNAVTRQGTEDLVAFFGSGKATGLILDGSLTSRASTAVAATGPSLAAGDRALSATGTYSDSATVSSSLPSTAAILTIYELPPTPKPLVAPIGPAEELLQDLALVTGQSAVTTSRPRQGRVATAEWRAREEEALELLNAQAIRCGSVSGARIRPPAVSAPFAAGDELESVSLAQRPAPSALAARVRPPAFRAEIPPEEAAFLAAAQCRVFWPPSPAAGAPGTGDIIYMLPVGSLWI